MPKANFHFHAELNDLLIKSSRRSKIEIFFNGHETVKHLFESLGVPHTEVDVILVNGTSVDFSMHLADGDWVEIYPVSNSLKIDQIIHLVPARTGEPSFVVDGHLGKLASYLRMLGFDTGFRNDFKDDELAEISNLEERILLTRDRGLLKRNQVRLGYWVRSKWPQEQIVELIKRFDLAEKTQLFSRCARCNGLLIYVSKADILNRLEPKTSLYYDEFRICQVCDQIYWKGSHFERLESQMKNIIELSRMRNY